MAISLGLILASDKVKAWFSGVNLKTLYSSIHLRARFLSPLVGIVIFSHLANGSAAAEPNNPRFTVLVFSKTTGFRHESIPQGVAAITALGVAHGFAVDSTEDSAGFSDANLARYQAVVFLNTTGDVLDAGPKAAFERYIRSGGGFIGIHSASDTEYRWAWYGRLVGAISRVIPRFSRR